VLPPAPPELNRSAALLIQDMWFRVSLTLWCISLTLPSVLFAQKRTTRFTVLPKAAAEDATRLCRGPLRFDGTWTPKNADVKSIESHLRRVSDLQMSGRRIEHPERYFRQYIGIVVNNRKLIYVNAFCGRSFSRGKGRPQRLVNMCDGGSCFWGAVYDVATKQFSDLSINGSG
jgi:hypothetical protein